MLMGIVTVPDLVVKIVSLEQYPRFVLLRTLLSLPTSRTDNNIILHNNDIDMLFML